MSRTTIKVDRLLLAEAIQKAESNGPLKNLNELWNKAAGIYNNSAASTSDLPEISFSVVALRATQWKLERKTIAGKKGRGEMTPEQKASWAAARAGAGKRKPKAEKFASNPAIVSHIKLLREKTPERFQPLVDQVEQGSRSAAVKLHCLECSSYMTSEVRQCCVTHCPLFAFRPYQGVAEGDEDVVEELLEVA